MFYDRAKIEICAGNGGPGAVSFRREKYVPKGGPDGGDGGDGGDVIFVSTNRLRDLVYFQRQRHFRAVSGRSGQGARKHGKRGDDVIIEVPPGTQLWSIDDRVIADLTADGQRIVAARGGKGGRGNAKFASSTRRVPRFAELGLTGEELALRLELKLLADAGLLGFPNAGKSSLLRQISHAKPKVADYPFTTVAPMLGTVVEPDGKRQFTVADIPGLLEGASQGVGLGDEFLAHLERTRLLIHVVDITGYYGQDPVKNFNAINKELEDFGVGLREKSQLVVLNKIDLLEVQAGEEIKNRFLEEIVAKCRAGDPAFSWLMDYADGEAEQIEPGMALLVLSAATGQGADLLIKRSYQLLEHNWQKEPFVAAAEPEGHTIYRPQAEDYWEVTVEDGVYSVRGPATEKLVARTDFTNEEAVSFLQERLEKMGVSDALKKAGAAPGDEVVIGHMEFEFW